MALGVGGLATLGGSVFAQAAKQLLESNAVEFDSSVADPGGTKKEREPSGPPAWHRPQNRHDHTYGLDTTESAFRRE